MKRQPTNIVVSLPGYATQTVTMQPLQTVGDVLEVDGTYGLWTAKHFDRGVQITLGTEVLELDVGCHVGRRVLSLCRAADQFIADYLDETTEMGKIRAACVAQAHVWYYG